MAGEQSLRADHHRPIDHLAFDLKRAPAFGSCQPIGLDDSLRRRHLRGARRLGLVDDRNLSRMDATCTVETELARALDHRTEPIPIGKIGDRADIA